MILLRNVLFNNEYLLVLDGVERVLRAYGDMSAPYQGDEVRTDEKSEYRSFIDPNLSDFIKALASCYPKTKTLLTSRLFPRELDDLEGCIKKELTQLDKDDAVEFFQKQGVKGTRAEIEEVCDTYGSHPLLLRLLSGMIVHDLKSNGDIKAWTKYNPLPKLIQKEHHVLELAYNSLDKKKQSFVSKLSAFRNSMDYDAVLIFNDFGDEKKFNDILNELVDSGMLFRDEKSNKFDMHPVVRKFCYDRLGDREGVHSKVRAYYAVIPAPNKIESVDDLASVIELYHHTVRAGRYEEAAELFKFRLHVELFYKFGAYYMIIELLSALFTDGEDKPPRLKDEAAQAWMMSAFANSVSHFGYPRRALPLYERSNRIFEKIGNKGDVIIGLGNLAHMAQIQIGILDVAESNLRRSIEICCEIIHNEFIDEVEAVCHQKLGWILAIRGESKESKNELTKSTKFWREQGNKERICLDETIHSLNALLMSRAEEALQHAIKALDYRINERDIIRTEYVIGAAHLMKGNLPEAEKRLTEALIRDRKINMVDYEPDILLEFAKLRFKQNHKPDALKSALEALQIADRCEYRLKQADIHNFLAEFYLDAGDLPSARQHGEIAKVRAGCGYVPAMEKAEKLLKEINIKSISDNDKVF